MLSLGDSSIISFRKQVPYSLIANISDGHALIGSLRHIPGNLEVMISETSLSFMRPFLSGCELNAIFHRTSEHIPFYWRNSVPAPFNSTSTRLHIEYDHIKSSIHKIVTTWDFNFSTLLLIFIKIFTKTVPRDLLFNLMELNLANIMVGLVELFSYNIQSE